nr:MAG: ORF1 [TTV-like mini virus]
MPPFRRYYYNYWNRPRTYRYRRRVRRLRRRRPRKIIRKRYRRRHLVRRKRFSKKKKKFLKILQWQPKTIKYCKITGYKCLFWAGQMRVNNNYAQYQETFVHPRQPGGGGWSYLLFSLASLWEEHQKDRNWWTVGNQGLPLCRYMGCVFKFFRDKYTDYAVNYCICPPMLDAPLVHANSSPYNMLLLKHRIIVPSLRHQPYGKKYIKRKFHPPSQLKNKWYFQQDLCNTGLLLLTTTSVDLDSFYISSKAINNNCSIYALDYKIFQNSKMINQPTTGYKPNPQVYLWCNATRNEPPQFKDLAYLGRPGPYTLGKPMRDLGNTWTEVQPKLAQIENWGNPFHPNVLNIDTEVYICNVQYTAFKQDYWEKYPDTDNDLKKIFARRQEPLYTELRYNPDRDTGDKTTIYLVSNTTSNNFEIPEDENITIKGFPLYLGLWSWIDWQKKLATIHNIDSTYILCFQTPFTEPKMNPINTPIIPLDKGFLEGKGPYDLDHRDLNKWTLENWYPKVAHQLVSIDNICSTGPAVAKFENSESIQAHCHYKFKFKWGGCPAPMVNLTNPCLQSKYPVPDQLIQRLQAQDPKTPPQLEIHDFDERHQTITKKCIDRIQEYTTTEQTLSCFTGPSNPRLITEGQKIQKEIETSDSEEEKAQTEQQQLLRLRNKQKQLRRAILRLMHQKLE